MKNPGPEAERVVEEALELLIKRNPFFVDYHHAKPDGEMDGRKIDFLIFLANFFQFALQIKAGRHARQAVREHYKKCPFVFAINVRRSHGAKKISEKIEKIVLGMLRNPMRARVRDKAKIPTP